MVKTKRILIALAVIGANMLHTMPVHTALADYDYTIKCGSETVNSSGDSGSTYTDVVGNTSLTDSPLSGIDMIVRRGTYTPSFYGWSIKMVVSDADGVNISNNNLTINNGSFNSAVYGVNYAAYYSTSTFEENHIKIDAGTYHGDIYGVYAYYGEATGNTITIENGTFSKPSYHYDIYAAKIQYNGNVTSNKITINGGTYEYSEEIVAGFVQGNGEVIGNETTINGGTFGISGWNFDIKAGYTGNGGSGGGNLKNNILNIAGGTFASGAFYGGDLLGSSNTYEVSGNKVNVTGGTFNNSISIFGGHAYDVVSAGREISENTVTIKNVTLPADSAIYGGYAKNVTVKGNGVTIENATLGENVKVYGGLNSGDNGIAGSGSATGDPNDGNWVTVNNATFNSGIGNKIYGASATGINGQAYNNKVTINNGTFTGAADFSLEIAGGKADSAGTASNNSVNINNGTFIAAGAGKITIIGGDASSRASNNSVTIKNGVFQGAEIIGGRGESVTGNKVIIDGGTFNGINDNKIYGACINGGFEFSNNEVVLNGGIFTNATIIAADGNAAFSASGNKITIAAGSNALDLSGATLMGYETVSSYGLERTLNVARTNVAVKDIKNFSTIAFDLTGVSSDSVVLKMQGSALDLSSWNVANITVSGITLDDDDYITLMKNVSGSFGGTVTAGNVTVVGTELVYYTGTTPAALKGDYTITQGSSKSEGNSGIYTSEIAGNTALSTSNLNGINMVVRRGTYENTIYAVKYDGDVQTTEISGNKVTIYDGSFKEVYSAYAKNGQVTGNILTIEDGTFADGSTCNIYAGYVAETGKVEGNKIFINGGDVGNGKTVAAGYIFGTGDAIGNEITITGGKIGGSGFGINIYGAEFNKGSATGNKVNISGGEFGEWVTIHGALLNGALTAGDADTYIGGNEVNITGGTFDYVQYIYGGDARGYEAKLVENNKVNIKNVTIEGQSSTNKTTIYGGHAAKVATNGNSVTIENAIIGNYVEVYGGYAYGTSAIGNDAKNNVVEILDGITMDGTASFITVCGGIGIRDVQGNTVSIKSGAYQLIIGGQKQYASTDAERAFAVSGNSVKMTGGTLVGGTTSIDGSGHIYGGISSMGISVDNNTVELDGVMIKDSVVIYGGYSMYVPAFKNSVTVANLQCEADKYSEIYGGYAGFSCSSNENTVTIKGGAWEKVFGGRGYTGADSNTVIIDGGSFKESGEIYSGYTDSGNANENYITINAGTFNNNDIGAGYTDNGNSDGNIVIINDGNFENYTSGKGIWGGYSGGSGNTNENKVYVNGGTFSGYISFWGGYNADNGEANNNYVEINSGSFGDGAEVYGGYTSTGMPTGNIVKINNGNFGNVKIYAGCGASTSGEIKNNFVEINDGSFGDGAEIYGGYGYGNTNNNTVTIKSGTFGNTKFYGGKSSGGSAEHNTINIFGGTFADGFMLYGGHASTSTNNTLNLKIKMGGKAAEVWNFQNMNFELPSNITDGESMLETTNVTYHDTTIGVTAADGLKLNKDDVIYLVKTDYKNGNVANIDTTVLGGAAQLSFDGSDNLILTLLQDFEQKKSAGSEDQQKAPVEGIAAAVQTVNMSADLASGEGMKSLIAETAGGVTNTFGALTTGQSKYKTGSHVDIDGWGLLVGAGKTKEWGNGEATSLGVFFEYGKGDFDTYNGNVHGDGNSKNQGIGIMMRHKMLNNTYYEGNIRYGKQSTEWSESKLGSYDTDSRYYGISIGMGHIYQAGKNEIDVYGRYTFGHVGACDATIGNSHYNFESVKSHRVRVGGKYNFKLKDSNAKPFIGLAWEHEFKGEARASISGVGEAPAPSMKGNVGIMELGCDWKVSKKWTLGLGANAYMGKRKGWDGMARVFYNF